MVRRIWKPDIFRAQRGSIFSKIEAAMAQYEHLPIFKKAYDLALYFERIVRNFSRYHKYTLGSELRAQSRVVLQLVRRANNTSEKITVLLELREQLEALKLTIRFCKDVKAFPNFNSFQYSINEVVNLAKQNEGWLKAVQKGRPEAAANQGAAARAKR